MQFVCVKWGEKFEAEYVNRLFDGISEHLTIPHDFVCFTDDAEGVKCRTRPLLDDFEGFWNKISLFAPQDYVSDRIAYLDLDVHVRGNVDHIFSRKEPFIALNDRWVAGINSSLMIWDHSKHHFVYENFNPEIKHRYGDQGYIGEQVKALHINDEFPDHIKSYKADLHSQLPKNDERIVYFHGKPTLKEIMWNTQR